MLQCGAIQGPIERNSAPRATGPATVHDLNVPYEGTEEYETPTAEMLFPPTPLQTPMQTPMPSEPGGSQYTPGGPMQTPLPSEPGLSQYTPAGPMQTPLRSETGGSQYTPAGPSEYSTTPDMGPASEMKSMRPPPYVQQPSPWTQRPLGVDVNVAYDEAREEEEGRGISQPPMKDFFMLTSGKRKREDYPPHLLPGGYIPQQDGSGDAFLDPLPQEKVPLGDRQTNKDRFQVFQDRLSIQDRKEADTTIASMIKMKQMSIPQQDGVDDVYDDGGSNEDFGAALFYDALTPHNAGTPKPAKNEALEDDEPPLNEDDDDDADDFDQGDEEPSTNHLVLAQFEKVSRTKSRWKCTLKDGIMHLNNKDVLFTKATGDFEF
ncbi:hypothetical protein ACLOJK_024591 [Asimina triloba]